MFYLLLIFAPYLIGRSSRMLKICLLLGVFTLPSWLLYSDELLNTMLLRPKWLDIIMLPLLMGMAVFLTGVVSYRALAGRFTGERIFSCILTFLLIGVAFADLYLLMIQHYPESFSTGSDNAMVGINAMLYFSFTTLTTCGYGDILPTSAVTRMLASLEMVTGVLFVAIFIAVMLREHGHRDPNPPEESS